MNIKVIAKFLNPQMHLPQYAHKGDAGMDLRANLEALRSIGAGTTRAIPTGLYVELPESGDDWVWMLEIRPRSGLALDYGIIVANTPGTIDSNYRGEIKVLLHNMSNDAFIITPGMRIAQMVLTKAYTVDWEVTDSLNETERNAGGFGSSGHE